MLFQQSLNLLSQKNFLSVLIWIFSKIFGRSYLASEIKIIGSIIRHILPHVHLNWWLNNKNGKQGVMRRVQMTLPQTANDNAPIFSFEVWEVGFKWMTYLAGSNEFSEKLRRHNSCEETVSSKKIWTNTDQPNRSALVSKHGWQKSK